MPDPEVPEPGRPSPSLHDHLRRLLENNPIVILGAVMVSGVGFGWLASEKIRVEPREFEIDRLRAQLGGGPHDATGDDALPVEIHVEIVQPTDGDTVDIRETITGTSSGVPAGSAVWIAVYSPRDETYYPNETAASVDTAGGWTSPATIGATADVGYPFEILAMLVDSTGVSALEEYRARPDRSGLATPSFGTLRDKVAVTRR